MLKSIYSLFTAVLFFLFFSSTTAAASMSGGDTVYVDLNATGLNNGSTWAHAYTNLQNALTAEPINKIFIVAKGTYYPSATNDPTEFFQVKNGQQLWGGFASGDEFHNRNIASNLTILSGDLNNNTVSEFGVDSRIIIKLENLTSLAILNGFEISGANNTGSDGAGVYISNSQALVANCTIKNNTAGIGSGIYSSCVASSPVINGNTIYGNTSSQKGGGAFINGNAWLYNNLIYGNDADLGGGLYIVVNGTSCTAVNNTVSNNTGSTIKGVVYEKLAGGTMLFQNNIIWDNQITKFDGTNHNSPDATDIFNCIANSAALAQGNFYLDPLFTNPALGDFTLLKCSPAQEKGDNTFFTAITSDTVDILGNSRIFDGNYDFINTIDIGAFESAIICEPCTTDAGNDQMICGLATTLGAKKPGFERAGKWTQISGPGVTTYNFDTLQTADISVTLQGVYTYRWTLTGADCSITDDVVITFSNQPMANAGADFQVCGKIATMNATPTFGSGVWTAVEAGVSFANNTLNNTSVTVTTNGLFHFVWTETNGNCLVSRDTVQVTFNQPSVANAGADKTVCSFNFNLQAVPSAGTGVWSQVSGPGVASISTPSNPNSPVNVTIKGTYVLKWTETNGNCPSSFKQVAYTVNQPPVADAGQNIDTCGQNAQLRAIPSSGTGVWSLVSGPGNITFNQTNNPNTTALASAVGQYTIRWTETNGPSCPSSSADIFVTYTTANTVTMQAVTPTYCNVTDEVKIQLNITGIAPYLFIIESPYSKDTITTSSSSYLYSDGSKTKGASQVSYRITKFVDGSGCGAIITNNPVTIARRGPDLQPALNGFYVNNDTLCTQTTGILSLSYFNNEALTFYIEDVAHGTIFSVNYQSGTVNIPVTNFVYGVNKFRITSVIRSAGQCEMGIKGTKEVQIVYKPVTFSLVGSNLTCFESNDGSLSLTNITGAADFQSVSLNGVPNNSLLQNKTVGNLAIGNYSVKVINKAKCELTKTVTLTQPGKINYNYIIKQPTCYGLKNGSVDIQTSGGFGTLTIHFNGSVETGPFKFINLGHGKYPVKITDNATGCIVFADTVNIVQPDSLILNTIAVDVNCDGTNNGQITIVPDGGTSPYTAVVSFGSFQQNVPSFSTSATVGPIQQGYYLVKLTDNKGCISSKTDTIKQGIELVFTAVKQKDLDCASGGTLAVLGSANIPGTKYSINGVNFTTDTIFKDLPAGNYTVYGKTPAGCIRGYNFVIIDNNKPLVANLIILKSPTCFDGTDGKIKVSITGGSRNYRVVVDNGIPSKDSIFDNLSTGNHTFTVVDINCGLITTLSYSFNNPSSYNIQVLDAVSPTCSYSNDGQLRLAPVGGTFGNYRYSIDNGTTYQFGNQFNNLRKGTYEIISLDDKGCPSIKTTYILSAPDSLMINASHINNFGTGTADITINASGGSPGYLYTLGNGSFTTQKVYNNVPFAFVIARVIDSKNCRNSDTLALGDVGIFKLGAELGISVYPNPNNGEFTLNTPVGTSINKVSVFNSLGQLLMNVPGENIINGKIKLFDLKAGIYQLLVETPDNIVSIPIEITQ